MFNPVRPVMPRFGALVIRAFSFPGDYEFTLYADTPGDRQKSGNLAADEVLLSITPPDKRFPEDPDVWPRTVRWKSPAVGYFAREMADGTSPARDNILNALRHALQNSPLIAPGREFLLGLLKNAPDHVTHRLKHWENNVALHYTNGDLTEVRDYDTRFTTTLDSRGQTVAIHHYPPGETDPRSRKLDHTPVNGLPMVRPLTAQGDDIDSQYHIPDYPLTWPHAEPPFNPGRDTHRILWQHIPRASKMLDLIQRPEPCDEMLEDFQTDIDPREWTLYQSLPEHGQS